MKQKAVLHQCQSERKPKSGHTVFYRLWCIRRIISSVVLVTFANLLLSPVFAAEKSATAEVEKVNISQKKVHISKANIKTAGKIKKSGISGIRRPLLAKLNSLEANRQKNRLFSSENKYQPYLEVGGVKYFNQHANAAGVYDLFIPLLQTDDQLLFTDLRIFDRSGGSFEGNVHLGFRKLYLDKRQMFSVYTAFDRKRSDHGHWFNQITLGAELWVDKWFIGGNVYKPIGKTQQLIGEERLEVPEPTGRAIFTTKSYEKSMMGGDAELGYAFTDNFTGYAGGYYFRADGADNIVGPKLRFTYNYNQPHGRILGVLDGVSIEGGAQHDKPRGNTAYIGIKFKVGLTNLDKNSNLFGFERHMTELVRRDPDVVVGKADFVDKQVISEPERHKEIKDDFANPGKVNPKSVKPLSEMSDEELAEYKEWRIKKLELSGDISEEEIKKVRHKFVLTEHPDKCGGCAKNGAGLPFAEKFQLFEELKEAFKESHRRSNTSKLVDNRRESPNTKLYLLPGSSAASSDNIRNIEIKTASESISSNDARTFENIDSQVESISPKPSDIFSNNTLVYNAKEEPKGDYQVSSVPSITSSVASVAVTSIIEEAGTSQQNSQTKTWVLGPIKWANYLVDGFFDMLMPIKSVRAIEITEPVSALQTQETILKTKAPSYSEKLVDSLEFIGKALLEAELSPELEGYYGQIREHLDTSLIKTGGLPQDVIKAIFHVYSINQNYFKDLVVKFLAEDNHLPSEVLRELINTKESPFITLRLVQNRIDLPAKPTLAHFIKSLSSEDESSRIMAINLYYQLKQSIPQEIKAELTDALITLLPDVSHLQRIKINEILNEFALNDKEKSRLAIQHQVVAWSEARDIEKKKNISAILCDQINNETSRDLVPFFKKNLALQNKDFLEITKNAFARLDGYQKISWSEEEKESLSLFEVIDDSRVVPLFIRKWMSGIYSHEVGNGVELLLNQKQQDKLQARFKKVGWDVEKYFKKIIFINVEELNEFARFIEETGLIASDLNKVLDKYSSQGLFINTTQLYTELLQNLIIEIKLPSLSDERILRDSIKSLLEYSAWKANSLFYFIKKGVNANNGSAVVRVLALLSDYKTKINPDTTNREGKTTAAILKEKSLNNLVSSIDRLIRDNSFFLEWDVNSLIKELKRLNPDNPEIEPLITGFTKAFDKKNLIAEDWVQSRYKLELSDPISEAKEGYLYLYEKEGRVCLATKEKSVCADDDKYQELANLRVFFDGKRQDITSIYEQAIKLNMVPKLRGITKPLTQWQGHDAAYKGRDSDKNNDFLRWRTAVGKINPNNTNDMAEFMAVSSQLIANVKHYYPRPVQLLGLFAQAVIPNAKGVITQISTGEGKSIIIFMLAALDVMSGSPAVDIVTSSYEFAIRDTYETKPLYNQLGISVDNNAQNPDSCYKSIVVYGDAASFVAAILRSTGNGSRRERGFGRVIVDEEDSMLFDSNNMLVLLASQIPELEVFNQLFTYMYGTVREVASVVEDRQFANNQTMNGCYLKKSLFDEDQKENPLKSLMQETFGGDNDPEEADKLKGLRLAASCDQFIEDYMRSYTKQMLNQPAGNRAVNIPHYLKDFAESQVGNFVLSLLSSFSYEQNVDYIIKNPGADVREGKDNYSTLEIVDAEKTGTIMYGLLWENGLHQFLQIRLGLTVIPESIVSIFMSYVSFFLHYDNTGGLSGTIGGKAHQIFVKNTYGLESMVIPRFSYQDLVKFFPLFAHQAAEAQQLIIDSIHENSRYRSRATLVITDTIKEVEKLKDALLKSQGVDEDKESEYPKLRIITCTLGGKEEAEAIKEKLKPGDVVIATNLGTRGTDLKISQEVRNHGGLHLIDTSYSESSRVEEQRIGRVARQGDPGSYQQIYNLEKLNTKCIEKAVCLKRECNGHELQKLEECMDQERSENEQLRLVADELIEVPRLIAKDNIRHKFDEFLREVNSPTGYKLTINRSGKWDELEDLTLNLYQDDKKIKLKVVKKPSVVDVDITSLVKNINPEAYLKISEVLSDRSNSKVAALTALDHEIIQFIAASLGYTQNHDVYNFAEHKLSKLFTAHSQTKEEYLRGLLKNDDKYADLQTTSLVDDSLLNKVELRQIFFLWEEGLALFSNGALDKQTVEDFGLWLKQVSEPPAYNLRDLVTIPHFSDQAN